jgi:hypothetical protein
MVPVLFFCICLDIDPFKEDDGPAVFGDLASGTKHFLKKHHAPLYKGATFESHIPMIVNVVQKMDLLVVNFHAKLFSHPPLYSFVDTFSSLSSFAGMFKDSLKDISVIWIFLAYNHKVVVFRHNIHNDSLRRADYAATNTVTRKFYIRAFDFVPQVINVFASAVETIEINRLSFGIDS